MQLIQPVLVYDSKIFSLFLRLDLGHASDRGMLRSDHNRLSVQHLKEKVSNMCYSRKVRISFSKLIRESNVVFRKVLFLGIVCS